MPAVDVDAHLAGCAGLAGPGRAPRRMPAGRSALRMAPPAHDLTTPCRAPRAAGSGELPTPTGAGRRWWRWPCCTSSSACPPLAGGHGHDGVHEPASWAPPTSPSPSGCWRRPGGPGGRPGCSPSSRRWPLGLGRHERCWTCRPARRRALRRAAAPARRLSRRCCWCGSAAPHGVPSPGSTGGRAATGRVSRLRRRAPRRRAAAGLVDAAASLCGACSGTAAPALGARRAGPHRPARRRRARVRPGPGRADLQRAGRHGLGAVRVLAPDGARVDRGRSHPRAGGTEVVAPLEPEAAARARTRCCGASSARTATRSAASPPSASELASRSRRPPARRTPGGARAHLLRCPAASSTPGWCCWSAVAAFVLALWHDGRRRGGSAGCCGAAGRPGRRQRRRTAAAGPLRGRRCP